MGIKLMKSKLSAPAYGDVDKSTLKEFLCDTDADFASLPVASVGSSAVSIESGDVMVVNTSGKWVKFGG